MKNPLTQEQESLRGRSVEDMTDAQLRLWIDACYKMMLWVRPAKARRSWKAERERGEVEIEKREARNTD